MDFLEFWSWLSSLLDNIYLDDLCKLLSLWIRHSVQKCFSSLSWLFNLLRILFLSFLSCCLRGLSWLDSASSLRFFCFDDNFCTSFDVDGFWYASLVPKTLLTVPLQISEVSFQASFRDIFDMLLCLRLLVILSFRCWIFHMALVFASISVSPV